MTLPFSKGQIAVRGTMIALAVAAVIGLIVFALVVAISGPLSDAVLAAAYVGLGYLTLNLVVLGAGLLVRPSESWAIGAALATPVVIAAIGFGYAAYLGVRVV